LHQLHDSELTTAPLIPKKRERSPIFDSQNEVGFAIISNGRASVHRGVACTGGSLMKTQIRMLYDTDKILQSLQADGWVIDRETADAATITHASVKTEREARNRLHTLGLLTSGALRVKFPMRRAAATA